MVDRPRPTEDIVELRSSFSSPSFPSGHVMSSIYFYGFLAYLAVALPLAAPARAVLAALSLAVLVLTGPANVWLGVHWPSDVLAGWVAGAAWAAACWLVAHWLQDRERVEAAAAPDLG